MQTSLVNTVEFVGTLAVLSILLERSLSVIFEHRIYQDLFNKWHIKEIVAFWTAYCICNWCKFDIYACIFAIPTSTFGTILTALAVGGGAKGSIKLFQDVLGISNKTP